MDTLRQLCHFVAILWFGLRSTDGEFVNPKDDNRVDCRDGMVSIHRGCYKFVAEARTWEDAEEDCEKMSGELTTLQSFFEKESLEKYLKSIRRSRTGWWVYLRKDKGSWQWGDNSNVDEKITPWKSRGIRERPGFPCGYIDMKRGLRLASSKCSRRKGYICEFHDITPRPSINVTVDGLTTESTFLNGNSLSTQGSTDKIVTVPQTKITTTPHQRPTSLHTTSFTTPEEIPKVVSDATALTRDVVYEKNTEKDEVTSESKLPPLTYPPKSKHAKVVSEATTLTRDAVYEKTTEKDEVTSESTSPPFTYPPKSKHTKPRVVLVDNSVTPISLTPPPKVVKVSTNPTTRTTLSTTMEDEKLPTTHSQPAFHSTSRVTRSMSSLSPSDLVTFTTTQEDSIQEGVEEEDQEKEEKEDGVTLSLTTAKNQATNTAGESGYLTNAPTGKSSPRVVFTTDQIEDEKDEATTKDEIDEDVDEETTYNTKTTNPSDGFRQTSSTSPQPTQTTTRRLLPKLRSLAYWLAARKEFDGCYIPGPKATIRQAVRAARRLYKDEDDHCPAVTISRLAFPKTEAGETAAVKCRKGSGLATLECGDEKVCWQNQPDLSGCASPRFKALLKRIKEEKTVSVVNPEVSEEARLESSVNTTSELVAMTKTEDISMEDILVASEVLTAFTHKADDSKVKAKDKKTVEQIVGNVIKTGNNLLSKDKTEMWEEMEEEDKIRSATSLTVAMETATVSAAEMIAEPTVIKQKEENVEMEIQVLDIDKIEEEDKDEVVYGSQQSENTFSIPLENLKTNKKGRLAQVVFITHFSMGAILGGGAKNEKSEKPVVASQDNSTRLGRGDDPAGTGRGTDEEEKISSEKQESSDEDDPQPVILSHILSASIGGMQGHKVKLSKPVTFTMKHVVVGIEREFTTLCSFWDISQGSGQGFWSQEGCRVKNFNRSYTACECDHLTSFAILMDVHGYQPSEIHEWSLRVITIVGCAISCACLIASLLTFHLCTALQGERNSVHKNLAACLLVAELVFVAGVSQTENKIACSIIAISLHFFFLAAFTWMFLEGIHIIFMLVQVFDATRSRLPFYYAVGYGLPAIIVGISCIVYFPGYGTSDFCWLTTDQYFIWSFAGPVALILLVNAVFLIYAMTTVCRHSDYVFNTKEKGGGSPIRSWIQGALALEVLLGLTWVFGYFLLNDNALPLAYTFTILNSLQGLFIFIFHCVLNKKAQKEYLRIMRIPLGKASNTASTNSTFGKRTNTKSQEMTHSSSRKSSFHKHTNGNHSCKDESPKSCQETSNGTPMNTGIITEGKDVV